MRPDPEAIPDPLVELPSDLATPPDVAARAFPSFASGSRHAGGLAWGAIPPVGVGALVEGKDELLLVSAEISDFLQIADHKCGMVE